MELLLYLITLGVLSIVCLIGFFVVSKQNKAWSNKKVIFYYLGVGLFISACGFSGLIPGLTNSFSIFLLFQAFFAGLGFLVSWLWNKGLGEDMPNESKTKISSVLFVLINTIVGMIGFTLVFHYCNPDGMAPYFALSIVPFVLPQFISVGFTSYREIPHEIHKIWYFPLDADEIDFDKIDTSTIYMLELEYSKSIQDPRLTNTKLRAPLGMKFGDWFRSFVENYNYKYDSDPIHYLNQDHTPHGWIFYVKPSFLGGAKYIDPDKTILENKLTEKRSIIARRVGFVEEVQYN